MTAIRIMDSHLELANIGTNTHADIDTHIADPSAHHSKYTDAEAVVAADVSNKFIERNVENEITAETILNRNSLGKIESLKTTVASQLLLTEPFSCILRSTSHDRQQLFVDVKFPYFFIQDDVDPNPMGAGYIRLSKLIGNWQTTMSFTVVSDTDHKKTPFEINYNNVDFKNFPIKGIKRYNQSAEPNLTNTYISFWRDTDDGKVYLIYKDATSGQKKVELT